LFLFLGLERRSDSNFLLTQCSLGWFNSSFLLQQI